MGVILGHFINIIEAEQIKMGNGKHECRVIFQQANKWPGFLKPREPSFDSLNEFLSLSVTACLSKKFKPLACSIPQAQTSSNPPIPSLLISLSAPLKYLTLLETCNPSFLLTEKSPLPVMESSTKISHP